MSYCRFSENSDVYMYASVRGGIECCACRLAPLELTIFSPAAYAQMSDDDPRKEMASDLQCDCGSSCEKCMMHGNTCLASYEEALEHLEEHRSAGHIVPDYAFEYLQHDREDGEPLEPLFCKCGEIATFHDLEAGISQCANCALGEENG